MASHSSTLAWKIPWMEEPGRLQSMGLQSRIGLSNFIFFLSIVPFGEGNGNPLRRSFLENPMDRGACLVAYSLWGCKELDMTKQLTHTHILCIITNTSNRKIKGPTDLSLKY